MDFSASAVCPGVREEQHVGGREVGIDVTNDASSDALADGRT
jgi:hypothetical protein